VYRVEQTRSLSLRVWKNGKRWISERWRGEEDRAIVHLRCHMDLPELHGNRVQQVHLGQEDVQLALPRLPHHDPHVLLRHPRLPPRPRLPPC